MLPGVSGAGSGGLSNLPKGAIFVGDLDGDIVVEDVGPTDFRKTE